MGTALHLLRGEVTAYCGHTAISAICHRHPLYLQSHSAAGGILQALCNCIRRLTGSKGTLKFVYGNNYSHILKNAIFEV